MFNWWLLRCTCIFNGVLYGFGGHLCPEGRNALVWLEKRKLEGICLRCFCNVFSSSTCLRHAVHMGGYMFVPVIFFLQILAQTRFNQPGSPFLAMVFQIPQVPKKAAATKIKKDDPPEKPLAENPLWIQRQLLIRWPVFKLKQKLTYLKQNSEAWRSSGFLFFLVFYFCFHFSQLKKIV